MTQKTAANLLNSRFQGNGVELCKVGAVLSGMIHDEISELTRVVDRAQQGWEKAKTQNDDYYLDGVALIRFERYLIKSSTRTLGICNISGKFIKGPSVELTRRRKPVAVLLSIQEYERLSRKFTGFWSAVSKYRRKIEGEGIETSDRDFKGLRDVSSGRDVELEE